MVEAIILPRSCSLPDSIDIYAGRDVLDSIKYVYTERLNITNLTDTVIRQVPLLKTRGVKSVPDNVKISLFPDILTEEKVEVPIVAVNMPEGKILRTFPSRVTVTFTVGASMFRTIQPDKFKVIVDYNELIDSPSENVMYICVIFLTAYAMQRWM